MRRSPVRPATLIVQLGTFVLVLGVPDGAIGVLWPSMRQSFHLPLDDLGVLTIAGTALYFSGGLLGDRFRAQLGVGFTMLASCLVALAALVGWSLAPNWLTILLAVATLGLARGVIDAVANAEAALDGGVRRLGILHACWAVGGTLGPILVAAVVAGPGNWRLAVAVVAGGVVLVLPFAATDARRPTGVAPPPTANLSGLTGDEPLPPGGITVPVGRKGAPQPGRRLVLRVTVVTFAVYTAAEAGPIAWGYTYLILDRRLAHLVAAAAIAAFWAALTLGRFGLAVLGERAAGPPLLETSCLLLVAGTGLFWLLPGALSIIGLPVAGLGSAAVFPLLVALTPLRIGEAGTGRAVGASIAAASLGGPVAVALLGLAAARFGVGVLGGCVFGLAVVLYCFNRALTVASRKVLA